MMARSKLNSIERTISKTLIDDEVSHEYFTAIINEERNYHELIESIRMMKSQRSDIEKETNGRWYTLFYKQHFCKQHHAEIGKKSSKW